jgi:putative aminopeptidase FrvX
MKPETGPHPILDLFTRLLDVPSPSGREERLAERVRGLLQTWDYEPQTDAAGNLFVRLPGQEDGPLHCLAAHMDEIGMVVTRVEDDGRLAVDRSGGLLPWKLGEGPVEILGDRETLRGILSMGSTHTRQAGEKAITWSDVHLITGHSPERLAEAGVRPGTTAVPVREARGPYLLGDEADPLVAAWTFDDRMGVAVLLRLLDQLRSHALQPRWPALVAFTVREEEGGHGAKILAGRERPEIFIAVDGCPMPPGAPLSLDGRPGIWSKDRLAHYDRGLIADLSLAAAAAGTALQPVVYDGAASDASLVFSAGAAPRVACFGHVRENSHGFEVARLAVFDNVLRTLRRYLVGG